MPTPLSELKKEKSYFKMLVKRDKDLEMLKKKHEKVRDKIVSQQVVCFSRLLKCLRSLYDKQCGPRSDLGPPCLLLYLYSQ